MGNHSIPANPLQEERDRGGATNGATLDTRVASGHHSATQLPGGGTNIKIGRGAKSGNELSARSEFRFDNKQVKSGGPTRTFNATIRVNDGDKIYGGATVEQHPRCGRHQSTANIYQGS
ncbi:MAG: hypothetical protein HC848_02530 [Limnobacter sp.]|nr:hypothetical protein [Limnobacter sp.]